MRRAAWIGLNLAVLSVLGCIGMRPNTRPPQIPGDAVPQLAIEQPVALRNVASPGEVRIANQFGWRVYADYHQYTESAIGAVAAVLTGQGVAVSEQADKVLELSVIDSKSVRGSLFRVTTNLRVRTGDGLVKEYRGVQRHGNGYGTTSATERTLAQCVQQLLNDEEIRDYLED